MEADTLKAITFNVFHDYPLCRHIERRLTLLEDALAAERPDVAILQELSVSLPYGHLGTRLVDSLRSRGLRYEIHYAPANGSVARGEAFEEGSAILSRWPIRDSMVRRLTDRHPIRREYQGYEYDEHRIAIAATIETREGRHVEVIGAHLTDLAEETPAESARRIQIEDLLSFVEERASGRLAILGGDFNAPPESAEIGRIRAYGLIDVCEGRDPGATNDPNDRDLEDPIETARHRIDHLFVRPGPSAVEIDETRLFLAQAVEVGPGRHLWASDHNGILARVRIRPR